MTRDLGDAVGALGRSFRLLLARRPWTRWLAALIAACLAAWAFVGSTTASRQAADRWGATVVVWVADRDHDSGDPITATARELPVAVVPPAAVIEPPGGGVIAHPVGRGEIVVASDLAGPPGPTALAPAGWVVVAIDDPLVAEADPGAPVVIAAEGLTIAAEGVVTASEGGVLQVAVPADDAPMVAAAARQHLASVLFPAPD